MDELIAEAKKRGIKIVMDLVLSLIHISQENALVALDKRSAFIYNGIRSPVAVAVKNKDV